MPPPLQPSPPPPPGEHSNMSDLIAIIGLGVGMSALAHKGVGGGRVALLPAPQHYGQAPPPQTPPVTGARASGPASGLRGRGGGGRPSPDSLSLSTQTLTGKGLGSPPRPPRKAGDYRVRGPCPASLGGDVSFAVKFLLGLSGSPNGAQRIPQYLLLCTPRQAGVTPSAGAGPQMA